MIPNIVLFKTFFKLGNLCTDNNVFRLHYRFTVIILLLLSFIVSSKQFFGDPIYCIGADKERFKDAMNSFCWVFGTYTVKQHFKGTIGRDFASPGVGASQSGDELIHHKYYQWVYLVLLLQAGLFYMPRGLWKLWEGGRIKLLTMELNTPIVSKAWTKSKKDELVNYVLETNAYSHNYYAFQFALCECLNFGNVLLQIFFLNKFLGGSFSEYGAAVASFRHNPSDPNSIDPMAMAFPKVTKCTFHSYGSAGSIQNLELLCILPFNVVNEKIFVFLWFWLICLAFVTGLSIMYRTLVFTCSCFRIYIMAAQSRLVPKYHIVNIVNKLCVGDWFILHQMGKNLNPFVFRELLTELGRELDMKTAIV